MPELTETFNETVTSNSDTVRIYAVSPCATWVYREYLDPQVALWQAKRLNDRWGPSGYRYSLNKPSGFLEPVHC